jgi:ketosteroid isomerase-like protein
MSARIRFAVLVLLAGAMPAAGRGDGPIDAEREKAALLRTDTEFSDAAQRVGVGEAFVRFADENATMLPAGEHPVRGIEGVRKQFADFPKGATLAWKPYTAEVALSGDLGYTLGTYESRGTDKEGKAVTRYGKYCSVWKKQKDGGWKWVVDVGTPSPAPAP